MSLFRFSLILSFSFMTVFVQSTVSIISNCGVNFICYNSTGPNLCQKKMTIGNLVLRQPQCQINSITNREFQTECELGCLYCYDDYDDQFINENNTVIHICTICREGYTLIDKYCVILLDYGVDIVFDTTELVTTHYYDILDGSVVSIKQRTVLYFLPLKYIQTLLFIFILLVFVLLAYLKIQPFIRLILNCQIIYNFSFKGGFSTTTQKILSVMNTLNFSFLNNFMDILPLGYFQISENINYFILNTDQNLIRNSGGCLILLFIIIIFCPILFLYLRKKKMFEQTYYQRFLIFWSFLQNSLVYFSLTELIHIGQFTSHQKTAIILRTTSVIILLLFCVGQFLILKLFSPSKNLLHITRWQLVIILLNQCIQNILLLFSYQTITQFFTILSHFLKVILLYYSKKQKKTNKYRFLISQFYLLLIYICLLVELPPGILIGSLIAYVLINLWDYKVTQTQYITLSELSLFRKQFICESKNTITQTDIVSLPTMKKLSSSTTDV